MGNVNAVSGPDGNAGGIDAFDQAFNEAVESVKTDEDVYQPEAKASAGKKSPVVSDSIEDAATAPAGTERATTTEAQAPVDDTAAPAHWDAAKREAFGALTTPAAKRAMLDLAKSFEGDFTRKTTELADDRKFASAVKSLLTDQHRAQMRSVGMDEVAGISHLVRLNDFATRDPEGYVRWVVESTGVDPRRLFPEYFAGSDEQVGYQPEQNDPNNQIYGILQALQSRVENFERTSEQQTLRTADRAIDRFRAGKDDSGTPLRPHFDRVRDTMIELLVTPKFQGVEDLGERLQQAYDSAVYMDPDIRTQTVDSEVQKRLRQQQAATDLAKAKRAIAPVRASPTGPVKVKANSLEQTLNDAMSELGVS